MVTLTALLMVVLLSLLENSEAVRDLNSIKVGSDWIIGKAKKSFIDMPTTTKDNGMEKFIKMEPDKGFKYAEKMHFFCLINDPRFCLFFDKNSTVAAIQISYPKCDVGNVDPNLYNFSNPNFVETNYFNTPAYSVIVYLVNPDELPEEGRKCSSRDVIDGLWAEIDGKLERFDTRCQPNSPVIDGRFFMQGCAPRIGQIYSRGFHGNSTCQNAFWFFLMFYQGSLVGFGHAVPGIASSGPEFDVFDHPVGDQNTEILLPDPASCFFDLVPYGFSAVYIYLIEDPWNIRCPVCLCGDKRTLIS